MTQQRTSQLTWRDNNVKMTYFFMNFTTKMIKVSFALLFIKKKCKTQFKKRFGFIFKNLYTRLDPLLSGTAFSRSMNKSLVKKSFVLLRLFPRTELIRTYTEILCLYFCTVKSPGIICRRKLGREKNLSGSASKCILYLI